MGLAGWRSSVGTDRMKKLTIAVWFLCCVAVAMLLTAAAPTVYMPWTAPRGTGGILVSTNRAAGTLTLDGSALSPQWTNVAGVLRPISSNQFYIYPLGEIVVGSNTVPILGAPGANEVFLAASDSAIDGVSGRTMQLDANNSTAGTYSGLLIGALDTGQSSIEWYHDTAESTMISPGLSERPFFLNSFSTISGTNLFALANSNRTVFTVWPNGAIGIGGTNVDGFWGIPLVNGETLVSIRNINSGDANFNEFDMTTWDSSVPNGWIGQSETITKTNESIHNVKLIVGGATTELIESGVAPDASYFHMIANGTERMRVEPSGAASAPVFYTDSTRLHTSGDLVQHKNFGLIHATVAPTNGITTPRITAYGAVSRPWQFGAASNTVNVTASATNLLEVTVNGVAYYIPAALK